MDRITVGLPIYNAMPYLRDAVESLLAQSDRRFRVLAVVDEGSDGSAEYMRSVKDSRFRTIVQRRKGLIPTLNWMLGESETPWLMRLDADDIAYPQRVARTLEYIDRYPDAGMFPAVAEYYPPDRAVGVFRASWGSPEELRSQVQKGYVLTFCHSATTLNVQKTVDAGSYDETLEHAEDADLWWRIALRYDIRIIPEALLGYRQHGGQSTTVAMKQNAVDLLYVQYRLLTHLWKLSALPKEAVRSELETFVPTRALEAKSRLRRVNIHLAAGKRWAAARSAAGAIAASPGFVLHRLWDDRRRNRPIVNGVDPQRFWVRRDVLWPGTAAMRPRP